MSDEKSGPVWYTCCFPDVHLAGLASKMQSWPAISRSLILDFLGSFFSSSRPLVMVTHSPNAFCTSILRGENPTSISDNIDAFLKWED